MTLKTSLIITGDSSVAKAAVDELTAAVKTAGTASSTAANDVAKLDKAQTDTAASAKAAGAAEREAAAGVGELERELKAAQAALAAQGVELNEARTRSSGFEVAQIAAAAGTAQLQRELESTRAALNAQGAELDAARAASGGYEAAQIAAAAGTGQLQRELVEARAALTAQGTELAAVRQQVTALDQAQAAAAASAKAAAIAQQENAQALASARSDLSAAIAGNEEMTTTLREQQAALGTLRTDHTAAVASIGSLQAELASARAEIEKLTGAQHSLGERQKAVADTTGLQRAGYVQLGAQMQDVIAQASTGTSIFTIAAQQGGQFFAALAMIAPQAQAASSATDQLVEGAGEVGQAAVDSADKFTGFGGAIGRAATFMAGPWGAIVLAATTVLGKFAWEAYNTEETLDDLTASLNAAASAADSWGNAQSLLAKVMDLGTEAIKTQNTALIEHIRLQAQLGIAEAQAAKIKAREELGGLGEPSVTDAVKMGFRGVGRAFSPGYRKGDTASDYNVQQAALRSLAQEVMVGGMDAKTIRNRVDWLNKTGNLPGYDDAKLVDLKQKLFKLPVAENQEKAFQDVIDGLDGKPLADRMKPWERPKKTRTPKQKSTAARDEFGRDAAARIADMVSEFDGTPQIIDDINGKMATLDDLIEDIGRRKPPGFEDLIASAEAAKVVVRDGLIAEIGKAFDKPKTLSDRAADAIGELDAAIADLQKRQPVDWEKSVAGATAAKGKIAAALNEPIAEYLRQQDEASQVQTLLIAGRAAEAEALEAILRLEKDRGRLTDQQREAVRDIVAQRRDEAAALERLHRRQSVYLDLVRDTRDAIEDSVQALVRGDLKELLQLPNKLIASYQQAQGRKLFEGLFGDSFAELERALTEGPVDKASRRMAAHMNAASAAVEKLGKAAIGAATEIATGESPADITVTGTPPAEKTIDDILKGSLGGVAEDIAGLFTSPELAKEIGDAIGSAGASALKGAATGKSIATMADQLGFGHLIDGTGAQIGGAIGSFLPIPGGEIIGSVVGGLIGSTFEGPTRSGYSSIATDAAGNGVTAISGGRNSEGRQKESLGYAGAVVDGLGKIAASLGGRIAGGLDLGTIGTQGDKYVFDSDGAGSAAGVKLDTLDEAIRAALSNAVSKGAVTGLSDAVRKALGSSSDVDKALAEALKVKQLETLMGGIGGEMRAMFEQFDNVAAERVRLAKSYGLDLLAVEKKNGEERAALLDETLKSRVGSLQAMLDDMRYGDLFEGDATERRSQILSEIEDAKQDATAGVDGAADRLAELYRLLLSTTRENFGTFGNKLTDDRNLAQSGAADIIKRETDRINAAAVAQKATTDAVVAGNKLLDEMADQIATTNAQLRSIENALTRGSTTADLSAFPPTARLTTM